MRSAQFSVFFSFQKRTLDIESNEMNEVKIHSVVEYTGEDINSICLH